MTSNSEEDLTSRMPIGCRTARLTVVLSFSKARWSGRLTKPEFPEIVGQKRHYYFFVVYSTSPWGHGEGKESDP